MRDPFSDTGKDLAKWLQEAARRKRKKSAIGQRATQNSGQPTAARKPVLAYIERIRWVLLSGLATVAFLQYFYTDTLLRIAYLPSIIFFVLVNGQLPPS